MNPSFLFTVCQRGAEHVLKQEVAREHPNFRFAYSRPGFVTFKLPEGEPLDEDAELRCVFARTHGFSLGKVQGDTAERLAAAVWQLAGERAFDHVHVWQRDAALPGDGGFEPGLTPLAEEVGQVIAQRMPAAPHRPGPLLVNRVAKAGHRILDCLLVEPDQWWIGWHRASSMPSRWPGGVPKIELPAEAASRTYLKTSEALLWSRLPIQPGDRCVEIGSAPGGSCQALLERGLHVIGIDPAEMDPAVLEHPNYTHIRARTASLKRSEFRGVRWLTVDSNVAPAHTLDEVEHIVTNRQVHVRGMLLTLKMPDWSLAEAIPEYLQRIRSWGYHYVNARQLAFDRQEICVAALQSRELRRPPVQRQRTRQTTPRRRRMDQAPEA
jgi:23S rRNA (cytidine2498-2'-O)-methyltransferase